MYKGRENKIRKRNSKFNPRVKQPIGEQRVRAREKNKKDPLARTIHHLPVFTEADGYPRTVGHGDVAISIPLLLVGGDEDLEIPCRVHDGNGERRTHAETGVKLLPALLLKGDLTFLMGFERRAHVGRNR